MNLHVLRYRRHTLWSTQGKWLIAIGLGFLFYSLRAIHRLALKESFSFPFIEDASLLDLNLGSAFVFLISLLCIAVGWKKWRASKTCFRVYNDRVVVDFRGKTIEEILFRNIHAIVFPPSTRDLHGATVVVETQNGINLQLSTAIEGVHYLFDSIRNVRPELIRKSDFEDLCRASVSGEAYAGEAYEGFLRGWFCFENAPTLLVSYFIPAFLAWLLYTAQSREYVIDAGKFPAIYGISGILLTICLQVIQGKLLLEAGITGRKIPSLSALLGRQPTPKQDYKEMLQIKTQAIRTVRNTAPIHSLIVGAVFLFLWQTDYNLYFSSVLERAYPSLKLHAQQEVWIDQRYNCVECKHPLTEGDVVWLKQKDQPAVLVAMPNETVKINLDSSMGLGHSPWSSQVKLLENEVAVQILEFNRLVTIRIPVKQIKGLLTLNNPFHSSRPHPTPVENSKALEKADFSSASASCKPDSLNQLKSEIGLGQEKIKTLISKRAYQEADRLVYETLKALPKKTAHCPVLSEAIAQRVELASRLSYLGDHFVFGEDILLKLAPKSAKLSK